jgi:hypothetical protein
MVEPARGSDNGHGGVPEADTAAAEPIARRTRRRRSAARPVAAEAPVEGADAGQAEEVEHPAAPEPNEPEMPTAAVVAESHAGPPRRGWWSRFVRKDD